MFRKPPANGKDALAERVRQLGQRAAPSADVTPSSPARSGTQRAPRPPVFKSATLTFSDGARLAVVIKDLTDAGARIEYFVRTTLPDEVLLTEPLLKLRRRARVVWQNNSAAGLHFINAV